MSELFPEWFLETVRCYTSDSDGRYVAQLLWQRGIRESEKLAGFLDPDAYQPTSPFAFGQEMKWALQRLLNARQAGEKVTIWGDFDADGITSTSVLWEGLGQFFAQHQHLDYYIPNRLKESHGLNCAGIDRAAASGTNLIITCDTGSTNLTEINYAHQLGIDIIITDHHTLPEERPPVISILNSRYFAEHHPLFHLSGVAVAYKLVEALYQTLPEVPQQPLEVLLDLVAIGLIADLVQLSGDCRYLAQKGIQQLQKQAKNPQPNRPGIAHLLKLCQKAGDRPTDISFGLGPRINAVSRIHGDASFCVELLTSRDLKRCQKLAEEAELANARRKSLQKDVTEQVKKKVSNLDLSTTNVIVLEDEQWQGGVLGLVAGQIAQEYGCPTILLSTYQEEKEDDLSAKIPNLEPSLARGSARSINQIDLYQLVASQADLLHRFGGHPFAAGLSLPIENIALFREAINQQFHQQYPDRVTGKTTLTADLIVTVAELGLPLFRELKLLEPCGMGNPVPKLLIKNCWFENVTNKNIEDFRGKKIKYIKTHFDLADESTYRSFPGVWWGHYREEIPNDQRCDVIVELDFNVYRDKCEVRLLEVKPSFSNNLVSSQLNQFDYLQDYRSRDLSSLNSQEVNLLDRCPTTWNQIQKAYQEALLESKPIALAYPSPAAITPEQIWQNLVGIAKYLSRTETIISCSQIQNQLNLSDSAFELGIKALESVGFKVKIIQDKIQLKHQNKPNNNIAKLLYFFLDFVREEQFKRQYFYQISLSNLQEILKQTVS